jgi:adenylosuccinate lyase
MTDTPMTSQLTTPLYASARARHHERPGAAARMLDFEAALARAEAALGVIRRPARPPSVRPATPPC